MNKRGSGVFWRVLLILAVSAVIVGLAAYQGRAIVGNSRPQYHVRSGPAVLEPVEGSEFVRSYPVVFNGLETTFGHYTSRLSPDEVVRKYRQKLSERNEVSRRRADVPGLCSDAAGCSVLSYATEDGSIMGIVAFAGRESGGSEYFVGRMPAARSPQEPDGDCPGRQPTGVPKPRHSTRTMCIENLGGLPSVMAFYEGWGRPSGIVEDLRHDMAENRWKERRESSKTLTANYEGNSLLSFCRRREQCIVGVDQERKTGKIVIMIFWAERPWLPEETAL